MFPAGQWIPLLPMKLGVRFRSCKERLSAKNMQCPESKKQLPRSAMQEKVQVQVGPVFLFVFPRTRKPDIAGDATEITCSGPTFPQARTQQITRGAGVNEMDAKAKAKQTTTATATR